MQNKGITLSYRESNVNKIEAMYDRSRVNVKVEPRATLTFLAAFHSLFFIYALTNVKIMRQWKSTFSLDGRKRIKMKTVTENIAGVCVCSWRIELTKCNSIVSWSKTH